MISADERSRSFHTAWARSGHGRKPEKVVYTSYLLAVLLVLIFAFNILLLKEVRSMGDASNQPLDLSRVRGGMLIGLLAVLQGLVNIADVILVVATIGGLCIGMAFRRAFQNPVIG